jgi:hypothetical protein
LAKKHGKHAVKPVGLTDTFVSYTASVGIGSPATQCESTVQCFPSATQPRLCVLSSDTLLIDTGSSNTFVGAGKAYSKTRTSTDTGNSVVRSRILPNPIKN